MHLKCSKGKKIFILQGSPSLPRLRTLGHSRGSRARAALAFLGLCCALQGRVTLEERTVQTPMPPPLQPILFLPTPVLHGTLDENFATYFMPAALIDIIAMQLQHRQTQVWKWGLGKGLMKEHSQDLTSCLYSSLFFTWYPLNAQQYTAQIFSP